MSAVPKKTIGRYHIVREVGAGGLGRVFKARDQKSNKIVAIKILHDKFKKNPTSLGFFHRELLIASRLKHKNIVGFIEANFNPPDCYIVTDFIDGWSLHYIIKLVKIFPPLVALSIALEILQGIDHLHLHDTIHSDLSSPNIMIAKNGRVLVTDFGLSCQNEVEDYKKYIVGTPGYYSPEHVSETAINVKSDLYCVGLLLYEMIAGTKAIGPSKNRHEILSDMKNIDFSLVDCTDGKLNRGIISILKKSLRLQAWRRYDNAEAMLYDIYRLLKKFNIDHARTAIERFLVDVKLSPKIAAKSHQPIYVGTTDD